MVSLGDTALCLHRHWDEGGGILEVKTQSAKICLNYNWGWGGGWVGGLGGVCSGSQISNCQDLPKFQLGVGGGGVGCSEPNSRTGCCEDFQHKFCLATFWKPLHHRWRLSKKAFQ